MSEGGCTCGQVRFRLTDAPVAVHCCHCSWCQRETGSAFILNAWIEADRVELLQGQPERIEVPTASGAGQSIMRCPGCGVALWSRFGGAPAGAAFVRVGTLDEPAACPPDVHIFTDSKQPWVAIPTDTPSFPSFYSGKDVVRIYGEDGAARWKALRSA